MWTRRTNTDKKSFHFFVQVFILFYKYTNIIKIRAIILKEKIGFRSNEYWNYYYCMMKWIKSRIVAFAPLPMQSSKINDSKNKIFLCFSDQSLIENVLTTSNNNNNQLHLLSSSAQFVATTNEFVTVTPTTTFEPILPDTNALIGFGIIIIVCAIAGWVWANQVVPVSRTNLAISKRNGSVREYLDELKLDNNNDLDITADTITSMQSSSDNISDDITIDQVTQVNNLMKNKQIKNRSFERWLFTDWLENDKQKTKAGRQKEPALPILKKAKWNSGDNPILAATALIMGGVIFTAITERIATSI